MDDYFVVIYKNGTKEPKAQEIFRFSNPDHLLPWLQNHKEDKIAVFKAQCVLDWS